MSTDCLHHHLEGSLEPMARRQELGCCHLSRPGLPTSLDEPRVRLGVGQAGALVELGKSVLWVRY